MTTRQRMTTRRLIGVVLLMSAALWSLQIKAQTATDACQPASGEPLELGAIFQEASLFISDVGDYWQGVQAMTQAINDCGGVAGRPVAWQYQGVTNRSQARDALADLGGQVPLIIGSGSEAVRDALANDAQHVVYWDVTERFVSRSAWAFSALPSDAMLGVAAANYMQGSLLTQPGATVALIYDDAPRFASIAAGFRQTYEGVLAYRHAYEDRFWQSGTVATAIRENRINAVVMIGFQDDIDRLWRAMRQADANVDVWLHYTGISGTNAYCYSEGMMTFGISGNEGIDLNATADPRLAQLYLDTYHDLFDDAPTARANLAAAGTVALLRHILPSVDGDYTPDAIRQAIQTTRIAPQTALFGMGVHMDADTGANQAATVRVQQEQNGAYCTILPGALSTCDQPQQPFPTWRERATRYGIQGEWGC